MTSHNLWGHTLEREREAINILCELEELLQWWGGEEVWLIRECLCQCPSVSVCLCGHSSWCCDLWHGRTKIRERQRENMKHMPKLMRHHQLIACLVSRNIILEGSRWVSQLNHPPSNGYGGLLATCWLLRPQQGDVIVGTFLTRQLLSGDVFFCMCGWTPIPGGMDAWTEEALSYTSTHWADKTGKDHHGHKHLANTKQ